jgi:excisionase family DNA binding protein
MTVTKVPDAHDPAENALSSGPSSADRKPTPAKRRMSRRGNAGRLLDLKEAEAYSGISVWTLRELIASGELPTVRPPGLRRIWVERADLDKAIAQWKDRAG